MTGIILGIIMIRDVNHQSARFHGIPSSSYNRKYVSHLAQLVERVTSIVVRTKFTHTHLSPA